MFYIRLCPNTKQKNKTKKHHLSKTKMITAKTAGFTRDAKIKMKCLQNTIATDKCLRKCKWTYPLTFSLHFCTSWPHSPCHRPVHVLLYQQTVLVTSGMKTVVFQTGWRSRAPCRPEWNPSCCKAAIRTSAVQRWQAAAVRWPPSMTALAQLNWESGFCLYGQALQLEAVCAQAILSAHWRWTWTRELGTFIPQFFSLVCL